MKYEVEAYDAQGKPLYITVEGSSSEAIGFIKRVAQRNGADLLKISYDSGSVYHYVALYEETPDGPAFDLYILSDEDRFYEHLKRSEYLASKNS